MTKDQKSLLMFLETCAVDQFGAVRVAHMNDADMRQARKWAKEGFIEFGRIAAADIVEHPHPRSHWVRLSPEAWSEAHSARGERAERMWEDRYYRITAEMRKGAKSRCGVR